MNRTHGSNPKNFKVLGPKLAEFNQFEIKKLFKKVILRKSPKTVKNRKKHVI